MDIFEAIKLRQKINANAPLYAICKNLRLLQDQGMSEDKILEVINKMNLPLGMHLFITGEILSHHASYERSQITMNSKHTPGPWKIVEGTEEGTYGIGGKSGIYEMFTRLAVVGYDELSTKQKAEANAHLIASAPELLEACRDALSYMSREWLIMNPRHDDLRENNDLTGFCDRLRKAISKAEGK